MSNKTIEGELNDLVLQKEKLISSMSENPEIFDKEILESNKEILALLNLLKVSDNN